MNEATSFFCRLWSQMETAQCRHCQSHSGNPGLQQMQSKSGQVLEEEEDILVEVENEINIRMFFFRMSFPISNIFRMSFTKSILFRKSLIVIIIFFNFFIDKNYCLGDVGTLRSVFLCVSTWGHRSSISISIS